MTTASTLALNYKRFLGKTRKYKNQIHTNTGYWGLSTIILTLMTAVYNENTHNCHEFKKNVQQKY